jgi:hypothetical protein
VHTGLWLGDVREREHFEVIGIDGRSLLKWIFKKWGWEVWTGLIRLMVRAGSVLF